MMKRIIIVLIILGMCVNIASAANNSDPFSPGSAKAAYDKSDAGFKDSFNYMMGIFWFIVIAFIIACLAMATASHSARESGQFQDPEKKASGAKGMVGIIFIVLVLILAISFVKPIFGF